MTKAFRVTMWVDGGGEPEDDPCVDKLVEAKNKHDALEKARNRVRDENPELNYQKIWAWTVHGAVIDPPSL